MCMHTCHMYMSCACEYPSSANVSGVAFTARLARYTRLARLSGLHLASAVPLVRHDGGGHSWAAVRIKRVGHLRPVCGRAHADADDDPQVHISVGLPAQRHCRWVVGLLRLLSNIMVAVGELGCGGRGGCVLNFVSKLQTQTAARNVGGENANVLYMFVGV